MHYFIQLFHSIDELSKELSARHLIVKVTLNTNYINIYNNEKKSIDTKHIYNTPSPSPKK